MFPTITLEEKHKSVMGNKHDKPKVKGKRELTATPVQEIRSEYGSLQVPHHRGNCRSDCPKSDRAAKRPTQSSNPCNSGHKGNSALNRASLG